MSNKSRLQTNNANLQALINKANALPDAGGASTETIINQIFFKDMDREDVSIKKAFLSLFIPDAQKTKYVVIIGGGVEGILGPDNGYSMEITGSPTSIGITITTEISTSTSGQTKLTINGTTVHLDELTADSAYFKNYLLEVT